MNVLRSYKGDNITIQLPGTTTIYDIDWLAVWCIAFQHNFGFVIISDEIKNADVPPALGQNDLLRKTFMAKSNAINLTGLSDLGLILFYVFLWITISPQLNY